MGSFGDPSLTSEDYASITSCFGELMQVRVAPLIRVVLLVTWYRAPILQSYMANPNLVAVA